MTSSWSAPAIMAMMAVSASSSLAQMPENRPPVLPKTSPTESIVVVDVAGDWQGKDPAVAQDALLAITCLQGLLNRASADRVYLVNFPWRLNWDWQTSGADARPVPGIPHASTIDGWQHPAQAALEDGLVPVPRTQAKLDKGKEFPALSFLLANYAKHVKGKVLCPATDGIPSSGARAAALNACTFEGALPLTPAMDAYAKAEGCDFPVLADTNGMDQAAAVRWSVGRYMNHPKRNRSIVGYCGDIGSNSPLMHDYFIATYTFCYFLYTKTKNDADRADAEYALLTAAENYPPATLHVGPVEGGHAIQRLQRCGHTVVCGFLANASVTTSFTIEPKTLQPATAKVHAVTPNDLYIAWEVGDDGDGFDVLALTMYALYRCDPQLGQIAGGMRVNPHLLDLYPTLYRWAANQPNLDLIASRNDGGASLTLEGQAAWTTTYKQYIEEANGSIGIVNFFGIWHRDFLEKLDVPFVIGGYIGESKPAPCTWSVWKNEARTVHTTILGPGQARDIRKAIRTVLTDTPADGKPLFLLCRAKDTPTVVKAHMDDLQRDPAITRRIHWLTPGDLAATYRSWQAGQQ